MRAKLARISAFTGGASAEGLVDYYRKAVRLRAWEAAKRV